MKLRWTALIIPLFIAPAGMAAGAEFEGRIVWVDPQSLVKRAPPSPEVQRRVNSERAQLESMMKAMNPGWDPSKVPQGLPTSFTLRAKGGSSVLEYEWGDLFSRRILAPAGGALVFISNPHHPEEVSAKATGPVAPIRPETVVSIKVTEGKGTLSILGYNCRLYEVSVTTKLLQDNRYLECKYSIWTTEEIALNPAALYQTNFITGGMGNALRQTKGVPLRIEAVLLVGSTVVYQATEVKREPVDDAIFAVPSGSATKSP